MILFLWDRFLGVWFVGWSVLHTFNLKIFAWLLFRTAVNNYLFFYSSCWQLVLLHSHFSFIWFGVEWYIIFFTVVCISLIDSWSIFMLCGFVLMDSLFTSFTNFLTGLLVSCQFLTALCILVMTTNSLSVISFPSIPQIYHLPISFVYGSFYNISCFSFL